MLVFLARLRRGLNAIANLLFTGHSLNRFIQFLESWSYCSIARPCTIYNVSASRWNARITKLGGKDSSNRWMLCHQKERMWYNALLRESLQACADKLLWTLRKSLLLSPNSLLFHFFRYFYTTLAIQGQNALGISVIHGKAMVDTFISAMTIAGFTCAFTAPYMNSAESLYASDLLLLRLF